MSSDFRSFDSDSVWLAFLLKDKYSSNFEKERLRAGICSGFNRTEDEIYYVPFERNVGLSYYFFVLEKDSEDLRNIYSYRSDAFDVFERQKKITGAELNEMVGSLKKCSSEYAKYGDIVTIRNGMYCKLHGIVLREDRSGRIVVGLKFCFGTVIETFDLSDVEITGNIFNYMKVLK